MEDRKCGCSLERLFDRFKGQPVEVITEDVRICGIVLMVCEEGVELIDKCSRIIFLPFRHIDAIIEPKMKLTPFCGHVDCECRHDDCPCEEEERDNDKDKCKDRY